MSCPCSRLALAPAFTAALLLLAPALASAQTGGKQPADSDTQSEVAEDAEVFPIEASAEPSELFLGMNPEKYGTTSPVRIKGRTLPAGSGKVRFSVEGPGTKRTGTLPVVGLGTFEGVAFTPGESGEYKITLVAPDDKGKTQLDVLVHDAPDVDAPDATIEQAAKAVEKGVDAIANALEDLPPSPAKEDVLPKLAAAKKALAAFVAAREPEASVSALLGAVRKDAQLSAYAQPRVSAMAKDMLRLRQETQRVRNLTSRFSAAAIGCDQLAFTSELFKAASALLNLKKSVLGTAVGLSKDILADFAGNAAKAKGASATLAFAVSQISKNAADLNRANAMAGNVQGMLADLGAFLSDTAFSTYCEQFVGPVHAQMEAHFFQPEEWWSYKFKITGRVVLYYPKNARGPSVPLKGRIEGVAHSFETQEDALTVLFPKLMRRAVQKKRHFPPISIGERAAETAVLGNEATSGFVEGSAAMQALPNSFLLDVTGVLEKDSISLLLGEAKSDFTAAHKVGVLIVSPLALTPVFTWYDLPFQTGHHVFLRASQGQAMRLKLTRAGNKMIAEGTVTKPAPTSGGSRGSYRATFKACNPSC